MMCSFHLRIWQLTRKRQRKKTGRSLTGGERPIFLDYDWPRPLKRGRHSFSLHNWLFEFLKWQAQYMNAKAWKENSIVPIDFSFTLFHMTEVN